ncbi:MAG TPA: right-handed parallel beta-helix repeat-containing protein [Chthoniobacterales bacterium]|nr:right-handed parallel beta-helix repeat-containing protein [Chthoniobacterales bacterium]
MKIIKLVTLLCAVAPLSTVLGDATVYPTGNPAQDVANVRGAAAGGGTVLLKAVDATGIPRAFDFGDYPVSRINWDYAGAGYVGLGTAGEIVPVSLGNFVLYVSLGNDVRLVGETVGNAMTTIKGGTIPIRNFAERQLPDGTIELVFGLANLSVQNIRFTESALQSVYTFQGGSFPQVQALVRERGLSTSIEIRNNEFLDVQPAYSRFWYALAAVTDGPTGPVSVIDNVIHFTSGRWDAGERAYETAQGLTQQQEFWEGFSIADLNAAGQLLDNEIEGTDTGLLVYFDGSDVVEMRDNRIELRPNGFFGIAAEANHRYFIERNTVIAPGPEVDGIVVWAADPDIGINDSVIRHNRLVMDESDYGGISLVGAASRNEVSDNKVEGTAAYALGIVNDFLGADALAEDNLFSGNNISKFGARDSTVYGMGADVFFDTNSRNNRVNGRVKTVKDLGQNNSVPGNRVNAAGQRRMQLTASPAKFELVRSHPGN